MTYGQTSQDLRDHVSGLLTMRHVNHLLGGPWGRHPSRRTPEDFAVSVELIGRYRTVVWAYARDALVTVIPQVRDATWGPVDILLERVQDALADPANRRLDPAELGTPQPVPLVEAWRRTAITAALASMLEMDHLASHVAPVEAPVVVRDAADLVWALARLDARYLVMPGWRAMADRIPAPGVNGEPRRPKGLMTTAARCIDWADRRITQAMYQVDAVGHRAAPQPPFGPLPRTVPSCATALDRARNALTADGLPNAQALASIVADHATLSARAARLAGPGTPLAAEWSSRASTYRSLSAALRRVGGNLGRGRLAAQDTRFALTLLPDGGPAASPDDLTQLRTAFRATDATIANVLARGVSQHTYFVTNRKRLHRQGLRTSAVPVFEPITALSHPELSTLVRELRPRPEPPPAVDTAAAVKARRDFRATLDATRIRADRQRRHYDPADPHATDFRRSPDRATGPGM